MPLAAVNISAVLRNFYAESLNSSPFDVNNLNNFTRRDVNFSGWFLPHDWSMSSKTFCHERYKLKFFTIVHRNVAKRKFIQYLNGLLAHQVTINQPLELRILLFEV